MASHLRTAHDSLLQAAGYDSFKDTGADAGPTILIVDDDAEMCGFLSAVLGTDFLVCVAATGRECLRLARGICFALAIVNLRLPDTCGLDVLRALRRESAQTKLILVSGLLTAADTARAIRAGAFHVIEKPIDLSALTRVIRGAVAARAGAAAGPAAEATRVLASPSSAAERWVRHVIQGCDCEEDPKTIQRWASAAAVSYSTLCETCRLVGLRPHHARDFVRVLRVLSQSESFRKDAFAASFDIGDRRTLHTLLTKAGLRNMPDTTSARSLEVFLERQTFVPLCGATYRLLRAVLDSKRRAKPQHRVPSRRG